MLIERIKVYGLALAFILIWWAAAFGKFNSVPVIASSTPLITPHHIIDLPISVDRAQLKQALSGDFALMNQLIAEWDIDAQILESNGCSGIQRLPKDEFLRAQSLGRLLNHRNYYNRIFISSEKSKERRFLPQTYAAASFLLALASPSQIIALPNKLREQTDLYPKELTDLILLDINRYNSEKLFNEQPEIAFVAHYSHPASLLALKNQGIQLYLMNDLNTLQAISEELVTVGHLIGRPIEAELMQHFLTAAMIALDNKLTLLKQEFLNGNKPFPKVLYVNYYQNFSVPTSKTLTGHFLQKIPEWDISLNYGKDHKLNHMWSISIDKEHLVGINPDCLIIASEHPQSVKEHIINDHALQNINAVRHQQLYFVNESIQQSPCQYSILAFSDLVDSLARMQL